MPCPYNDKASPRKNKGVLIKESAFLLNTGAIRRGAVTAPITRRING